MKVSRIKINGIVNPIGYSFDKICCSWLVSETEAKKTIHVKIDVAKEETFENILYSKEGAALNAACEQLDLILEARTRYYVRIAVTGDNKEQNEDMPVKEVICTPAGETVLDFGQDFAGYVTFRSGLPKGTKVVLDFGEILQKGNFYNANYRRAKSQFTYVSDGRKELVKPQFTYFGFRYVRVTGWVGELDPSAFMGRALYSDMKVTGHVETGNKKVNQLFSNIMWGQKSNSIDFPTDCPQRDERLGWTGDAQVFAGTASYNMDTAAFYHKFLHDLRTEQKKLDGILPGVIPVFDPAGAAFAAVWGDIATFLPAVLYEHYGDKTALETYYPMMKD